SLLSAPLFAANGLPLDGVVFDISGFDSNSTSSTDGNGNSCSQTCPVPVSGGFVALGNGTTGGNFGNQPTPPALRPIWPYTEPGSFLSDGLSMGDLTSTGGNEFVVVMEGGSDEVLSGGGRAIVLDDTGAKLSTFIPSSNKELVGLTLIDDIQGGGRNE